MFPFGSARLILSGPLAALLLLPAACDRPAQQADALAQQASQLAEAGDRLGAIEAINKAIAIRDDNAGYFLLLASINLRSGNPSGAVQAAQRALEVDAANIQALTIIANVGMQIGLIDDAFDAANRLLAFDPSSIVGLQAKGLYELYKNRPEDAEATAQRLLSLSPTDVAGVIVHTRVLAKAGKLEEALAFVDRAMEQSQASAPPLITEININRALGRPEDMAKGFERLAAVAPQRAPGLWLDEINLLYRLGRTAQARARTAEFLEKAEPVPADLAALLRIWWNYDRVPFTHETVSVAKNWNDPVMLIAIGRFLIWQGQPQLADDLYFAFPQARRETAIGVHLRAAFDLGRSDLARTLNDMVLQRDTGNVDALLVRAAMEERVGRRNLAIEAAQRALNSDQTDPEVYVALAELNARAGSAWRAAQTFEDGLRQLPQDFLLIERYTQFLHQSGNKSRAASVSRAFARAQPSSIRAWTIMEQQCAWAGDAACAAEASAGRTAAMARYVVDDPPGTPPDRSLLGKF